MRSSERRAWGRGLWSEAKWSDTRGRFVSAVVPAVMKCDTNGVTSGRPPALMGALAVTVYSVRGANEVDGVSV